MTIGPQSHTYEVNAMLMVSEECGELIKSFFVEQCGIRRNRVKSHLHLTIYHGRRCLPGLRETTSPVDVSIETDETRFMVLAPGGENPRLELDPAELSVGIRVTKRNPAISDIQRLRRSVFKYESAEIVGNRKATTAWTNCFGSRHYQPHIQMLRPWSKVSRDLTELGEQFRSEIACINFDRYLIESRRRIKGKWVTDFNTPH